jgi:hypothetical protein
VLLFCHAEPKAKHLGGELLIRKVRFFASLRSAQNDNVGHVPVREELANAFAYESVSLS